MIRFEPNAGTRFSIAGITDSAQLPADGETARVQVIEKAGEGWLRIRIGGKVLVAGGMANFPPGSEFTARIQYSGTTLYLHPVNQEADRNLLSRLGVPQTPVSSFLLSFFHTAKYRLDSGVFKSILAQSTRFSGREKRAAEAAAILVMQGIEPEDRLVLLLMEIIEGGAGGTDADERDILAFINQKKGHDRHWLTYPFKRVVHGRTLTGSIRFLIDTALERMLRTVLTVHDGVRTWDFTLEDRVCTYTHTPEPDTVTADKIVVYLQRALEQAGFTEVHRGSPDDSASAYSGIDVEI